MTDWRAEYERVNGELERVKAMLAEHLPTTDPRKLGGSIAGPGGPFDQGGVLIDASKALIVDAQEIAKVDREGGARGQTIFALLVEGRINQTQDRAKVVLFESLDGLAALITQAHGVAERTGPGSLAELHRLCRERWEEMPHDGA